MPVIVHDPGYGRYSFAGEHPFSPLRVEMVLDLLRELGVPFDIAAPPPATTDELARVHTPEYIAAVTAACRGEGDGFVKYGLGTPDNPVGSGMEEGARLLVGGTLHGARLIADGVQDTVLQLGGGLHHAMPELASGFCLYNDLAVAVGHLADRGLRVFYLDLDVHHGDGVQKVFYRDDRVMTLSVHESGEYLFPGTGWVHETGESHGRGFCLNLPLEPFTEDDSYLAVLNKVLPPALAQFRPQVMVVQAGADAHFSDPLADLSLTTRGFARAYALVGELADRFADGRVLWTLGGGYSPAATTRIWALLALHVLGADIPATLPPAWRERWRNRISDPLPERLHDPEQPYPPIPRREEITRLNRNQAINLMDAVSMIWL